MRTRLIAAVAAALIALPVSANAQSSGPRAAAPSANELAANYRFAGCALQRGGWPIQLMNAIPYSQSEQSIAARGERQSRSCVTIDVRAPQTRMALRGIIAELLLRRDFNPETGARRGSPAPRFAMPTVADAQRLSAESQAALVLVAIGECTARGNRAGLARLFGTAAGTPEERAAFVALAPAISACVPQGSSMALQPRSMRGYLAEGAYRVLSEAPAARS